MKAAWIAAMVVLALWLLLSIPVCLEFSVGSEPRAKLRWLLFSFPLFPREKRRKSRKPRQEENPDTASRAPAKMDAARLCTDAKTITGLVQSAGRPLRLLLRGLRVRNLTLQAVICREDAHQTAYWYGVTSAAVYTAYGVLGRLVRMRRVHLKIEPDFTFGTESVKIEGTIALAPRTALHAAASFGVRFLLGQFRQYRNGGAQQTACEPVRTR